MLRESESWNGEKGGVSIAAGALDRLEIEGEPTVYLREAAPEYVRDRQRAVLDAFGRLEAAGVLPEVPVVGWPKQVRTPADDHATAAVECYDELVEAVGPRALEPFFEEKPAFGNAERVLVLPVVCIVLRNGGDVTGLYPYWEDGTHHSVEDCLEALSAGESIANVDP